MVCTTRDGYMRKLIQTDLMISWKITLTDRGRKTRQLKWVL